MLTFDEARKIADEAVGGLNCYTEHEKSFVFSNDMEEGEGGPYPIVIVKETGKAVTYLHAVLNGLLGDVLKEGRL